MKPGLRGLTLHASTPRVTCLAAVLLLCLGQALLPSHASCASGAQSEGLRFALALADSIAQLDALILVSERAGDFVSLEELGRERTRQVSSLRSEVLGLMDAFDDGAAGYANDLAPYLLGPYLRNPEDRERTLKSLLPYVEWLSDKMRSRSPTVAAESSAAGPGHGAGAEPGAGDRAGIPDESGAGFQTCALAAGLILDQHGKHALASRYLERAAIPGSRLAPFATYLALEQSGRSREFDRMLALERKLEPEGAGSAQGADAGDVVPAVALDAVPKHILKRARLAAGVALIQSRLREEGRALLEGLLSEDLTGGESASVGLALGRYYAAAGDFDRAAKFFVDAFASGSATSDALAACDEYIVLYRKAVVAGGLNESLGLVRCLARGSREREAAQILEKLRGANPRSAAVTSELGRLRYGMKEYEKAASAFRRLQSLERETGQSQLARLWYARCERQLGRVDAALKTMREIASRDRGVAGMEAGWEAGFDFESMGRLEEAAREYASLNRRFPSSRLGQESLWRKGFCEFRRGDYSEARVTFSSVRKSTTLQQLRDMAAFWVLKSDVENGNALTPEKIRAELADLKPDAAGLYGAFLVALSSADRVDRRLLASPWADLRASVSGQPSEPAPIRARDTLSAGEAGQGTERREESAVSEKLPEEFYRASALLRLGLADLAKAELSACEKRLSGNREGLELVAQLYWRHGLYRRGVLLAERLLEGSGSVAGGEGAGDEVSAGGAVVNPGSGSESFIEKIAHPICFPDVLYAESRSQGVDPFLILSIIKKESVFEPAAVSRAGAIGLMQLMPATARAVASYLGEGEARLELTDPITNLRYGIWHFGRLVGRYSDSVVMALAAYNAGEENAERWLKGIGRGDGKVPHSADAFVYMESVSYRETRDYLHAVLADLHAYRELYRN